MSVSFSLILPMYDVALHANITKFRLSLCSWKKKLILKTKKQQQNHCYLYPSFLFSLVLWHSSVPVLKLLACQLTWNVVILLSKMAKLLIRLLYFKITYITCSSTTRFIYYSFRKDVLTCACGGYIHVNSSHYLELLVRVMEQSQYKK